MSERRRILIVGCGAIGIPVPACKTVYRLVKGLELAAQVEMEKLR